MANLARYLNPEVIQQVQRLDLRARFIVEGFLAGLHRSPFQGLSVEFAEHRKYVHGDDLRTIDWNVYARTDRLFVRKYAAETHLACHLIVDSSSSMGYVGPAEQAADAATHATKLDYAVHLAAALGYLVTRQQDAIGLAIVNEALVTQLPPRSRRSDLVHLLSTLSSVAPSGGTGLASAIHAVLARIPHRGVIVLLSDLLTDTAGVLEATQHIRFRGHDLIVMHVLDAAEVRLPMDGAVRLEDPESGETIDVDADGVRESYEAAVAAWRDELRTRISAIKGDYVPLDTSIPFDKALVEFLTQRSKRR
ncbi:MAG: DUF58 domain-containing protein [Phycisphaerae bacterium]